MDVLHTNIVVVDGRRYRVQSDAGEARSVRRDDPDDTPVATEAPSVVRDASPADGPPSRADSGEWQERVSVDADLAKRALGGPNGAARLALERDTGARVVLPGETPGPEQDARSPVANRGEALVVGATADRAAAGRAVFESLVREALEARSTPHTHFVGVPLDADALVDAARAFRAECLARANSAQSPPPMPEFAEPGRLRLAFFELKLCSDDARRAATRAMANAAVEVETLLTRLERETGTRAVSFSLRGVDVDRDGRLLMETRDDDARLASVGECFAAAFAEADVFVSSSFLPVKKKRRDRKGFERGAGEVADESRDGRDGVRDAERRGKRPPRLPRRSARFRPFRDKGGAPVPVARVRRRARRVLQVRPERQPVEPDAVA